jgi:hypothetical protein
MRAPRPARSSHTRPSLRLTSIVLVTLVSAAVLLGPSSTLAVPADVPVTTEYLIIAADDLAPEFDRLAATRNTQGIETFVIPASQARMPCLCDEAARIREFLIAVHAQGAGTLRFLLLGGSTDLIPTRYVPPAMPRTEFPNYGTPSDLYFAALDGTWDADGDGIFGEIPWRLDNEGDPEDDQVDFDPELAVGRAPVETLEEARRFVNKTLAYDTAQDEPWRQRGLVMAPWTYELGDFIPQAEEIIAAAARWTDDDVTRLFGGPDLPPGAVPLTLESAVVEMNGGDYGFVVHMGQGSTDRLSLGHTDVAAFWSQEQTRLLTNSPHYPVMAAVSCGNILDPDSVVRGLVTHPGGGCAAAVGFTNVSFVSPGVELLTALTSHFLGEVPLPLGEAVRRTQADMVALGLDLLRARALFGWTLLGDPTLGLPLADPSVDAPAALEVAVLHPNVPNPFNPTTWLRFEVGGAAPAHARLSVYDMAGRHVSTLVDRVYEPGEYRTMWRGVDGKGMPVASGVYQAVLQVGAQRYVRKMALVR